MDRIAAIAIAGAAGALARYGLSGAVQRFFPVGFPGGTLMVNIIGCFLIGILAALSLDRLSGNPLVRTALVVGFLGAFTTFSAFGYETLNLLRDGAMGHALLNVSLSILLGLAAVWGGMQLARLF
jgi:fluoride exporter